MDFEAFLVAQMVKHLPAVLETQVQSLGREDPLKKGTATHFSILAWRIHGQRSLVGYSPWGRKEAEILWYSCLENSWTEEPGGLQYMGSQRVRHD